MTIDIKKIFNTPQELNTKMIDAIIKAIKNNGQEGMDYLKFKQAVLNLQGMDMNEEQSIKSAFMSLKTMGLSKKNITNSITHYTKVIENERDKFIEALKNQIDEQIEKPKKEAANFDHKIEDIQKKIAKLQQEIERIEKRKETIDEDLQKARNKINHTRDEFKGVYNFFSDFLKKETEKLNKYL